MSGGRGGGRAPGGRGPEPRWIPAGLAPIAPRGPGTIGGGSGPAGYTTPPSGGALARETEGAPAGGGGGIYPGPARRRRALRIGPERQLTPPGYPSAAPSRDYILS